MTVCARSTRMRPLRYGLIPLLVAAFCLLASPLALGLDTAQVVRVEEDWELVVVTPDPNTTAPQVNCVISPVGNVESFHAALLLNYQGLPEFIPGGVQLQVWHDEIPRLWRKFPSNALMAPDGETVRWTQTMELHDGWLTFEVVGGTSTTWGTFGGQGYLKAGIATWLENLNDYNPDVSVNNSGVSFAANRVVSLVLKRVRLVMSDGNVLEDSAPRVIQ